MEKLTAKAFITALKVLQSDDELKKIGRYFKTGKGGNAEGDKFIGVKMGEVFALARAYTKMPLAEVERLLESPLHEARVGAVSIMDFQARDKKTKEEQRKALFDLYIRRHDRINNWDLVDRAAPHVVGLYLVDKPRKILYTLAKSASPWERRTSIVATWMFIRQKETADTFKLAEILLKDSEETIHKAIGSWLRTAGTVDKAALQTFLNTHGAEMPRIALRYAIEHFSPKEREKYLNL
ncbi:DNA alkylation repair protein [Flavihumibacter petaseus]|uniref:DNA alkylation repair enzyme n=1 Tax=Flavihumibacter petaseus NBRC 106054 TaxID=1220578 RepID=A0A0E9N0X8_9BACT|nr:DNA alkylation repair protein [Flavihumibacter petaseus]GAO43489.1 hypothetical protein FPE01S_02_05940 [Flavihumibacter petaseus NBRC 106054]